MKIISTAGRLSAVVGLLLGVPAAAGTPVSIIEFSLPSGSAPNGIAAGPDGNLWFTDSDTPAIGRISLSGAVEEFTQGLTTLSFPSGITTGADGNLWFTIGGCGNCDPVFPGAIGRIDPTTGIIDQFSEGLTSFPGGIATGPDGNVWFTEAFGSSGSGSAIGRITPAGEITEFSVGLNASSFPLLIAAGPDGNVWFTDVGGLGAGINAIGRITPSGAITEFSQGLVGIPAGITAGPDGRLWFVDKQFGIGRVTPEGDITEFSVGPIGNAASNDIVTGPDGNLWFTNSGGETIGRITPTGLSTEFTQGLNVNSVPGSIVSGADGNLWFTDRAGSIVIGPGTPAIGRLSLATDQLGVSTIGSGSGQVTSAPAGIACGNGASACIGSFADQTAVTLTATAAEGSVFTGWSGSGAIAGGCTVAASCAVPLGGNLDSSITASFAATPTTASLAVTTTGNGTVTSAPAGISCGGTCTASFAAGSTVALTAAPAAGFTFAGWSGAGCAGVEPCSFILDADAIVTANFVADSASDVVVVAAVLPTSRSVQVGATATIFATMINASPDTAGALCQLQPALAVAASFFFQTTDPKTNALTGTRNLPVTIAPGGSQSFVLGLTPKAPILPANIAFNFTCANAQAPAPSQIGLNTLLLSASTTPTPDVIALSATAGGDGIVDIPGADGTGAFAVATANVGSGAMVTASANVGGANLPVILSICQTVTATGQCMAAPAPSVTANIGANETPTFSVFVQGHGNVAFQPAANRVFVQFQDAAGAVRGSTSVAVRTQ